MGFATEIVEEVVEESFDSLRAEEELPAPVRGLGERRMHPRKPSDLSVHFRIVLENGRVFNRGVAKVSNLGPGGAMLTGFSCARDALPAQNFKICFKVIAGEFMGIEAECTPVRFAFSPSFGVGVRFESISVKV